MRTKLLASLLALFGLMTFFSPAERFLNWLTFFLILLAIWMRASKYFLYLILAIICLQVIVSGQIGGQAIRDELITPQGQSVVTDMRGFIKTYQLMKTGEGFYDAFVKGMSAAIRAPFKADIGGWREPLIFYLWAGITDSRMIYYLYEVLVMITLVSSYLIARKFLAPPLALLSPFILLPYFHYPLVDLTLLQVEWWALFFFIWGLAAHFYRRLFLAGILFALATVCRELFLIPILFIILLSLRDHRPRAMAWLVCPLVIAFIFYFAIHLPNIFSRGTVVFRSLSDVKSLSLVNYPLAFGSWSYAFGTYRPFLILIMLIIWGTLVKVVRKKWQRNYWLVIVSWLPFLILTISLSGSGGLDPWHDYWGIYFVPSLLIGAVILILPPGK